jgi:hypothetical protein
MGRRRRRYGGTLRSCRFLWEEEEEEELALGWWRRPGGLQSPSRGEGEIASDGRNWSVSDIDSISTIF